MEWISVGERLPENGEKVLFFTLGKHHQVGQYNETRDSFEVGFSAYPFTFYGDYEENSITHWMPLPDPPKETP